MDGVRKRFSWLLVVAFISGGLVGVGSLSSLVDAQTSKPIKVSVVDKAGYDKVIAANKGKVVVVDCWATWCRPCVKVFPKTVELSKNFSKDVAVVSLSFDDPKKDLAKVKKFLEESHAEFDNLVSSLDITDEGSDAFAIPDGALPHFKIYGKDGKLFKAFASVEGKEIKHEDIEAAVKQAIKAGAK